MSRWCKRNGLSFALGCVGLLAACARREAPDVERRVEPQKAAPPPLFELESAESRACAETLSRLGAEPALPGAPVNSGFERGYLLGRARAEPVAFSRKPSFDVQRGSLLARALREELAVEEHPAFAFERQLRLRDQHQVDSRRGPASPGPTRGSEQVVGRATAPAGQAC